MRSISEKMAIKPGMRAFLAEAPPDAVADMDFPDIDLKSRLSGLFDYIHVFCRTRRDLDRQFARLKAHVAPAGRLFVSRRPALALFRPIFQRSSAEITTLL